MIRLRRLDGELLHRLARALDLLQMPGYLRGFLFAHYFQGQRLTPVAGSEVVYSENTLFRSSKYSSTEQPRVPKLLRWLMGEGGGPTGGDTSIVEGMLGAWTPIKQNSYAGHFLVFSEILASQLERTSTSVYSHPQLAMSREMCRRARRVFELDRIATAGGSADQHFRFPRDAILESIVLAQSLALRWAKIGWAKSQPQLLEEAVNVLARVSQTELSRVVLCSTTLKASSQQAARSYTLACAAMVVFRTSIRPQVCELVNWCEKFWLLVSHQANCSIISIHFIFDVW